MFIPWTHSIIYLSLLKAITIIIVIDLESLKPNLVFVDIIDSALIIVFHIQLFSITIHLLSI